jgi:hypothetical protein
MSAPVDVPIGVRATLRHVPADIIEIAKPFVEGVHVREGAPVG